MRPYANRSVRVIALLAALAGGTSALAEPIDGSWTYQGELKENGQPANGLYTMRFQFFDDPFGGNPVGTPVCWAGLTVADGRFKVTLPDFVANADGQKRFLQIQVKPYNPDNSCTDLTTLFPRQELTSAPYADFAREVRGVYVNSNEQFVGVGGRTTSITSAEQFGVHRPTASFGGMYVSTNAGGEPFYGYAANGVPLAYHFVDGSSGEWSLVQNNTKRMSIEASGVRFFDSSTQPSVEIANEGGRSLFRRWNPEGTLGDVGMSFDVFQNDTYLRVPYRLAIGTIDPGARLEVTDDSAITAIFDRTGTDGAIVVFSNDGTPAGSISVVGATVSYNAFSGSHYGHFDADYTRRPERGLLLTMTGNNLRMNAQDDGETLHGVALTSTPNDPAVIGVYNGLLDEAQPGSDSNPVLVLAEGNGDVFVTDDGRDNIKPGDLLISAAIPGHVMLDDPARFPTGHIVARAAARVDWSKVTPGPDGVKRARLAVLFDRSIRSGGAAPAGAAASAR
ncbi:MAG: hypothetical protein SFY69_06750 [Planctomycetota bacterium]|nr:hypothetical protein [Planctomycetota bacterium]